MEHHEFTSDVLSTVLFISSMLGGEYEVSDPDGVSWSAPKSEHNEYPVQIEFLTETIDILVNFDEDHDAEARKKLYAMLGYSAYHQHGFRHNGHIDFPWEKNGNPRSS